jgi:hypothetical protein
MQKRREIKIELGKNRKKNIKENINQSCKRTSSIKQPA